MGRTAEVAVTEDVGQRQPEEGGQSDDGVDLAALGGVEVEFVDEEQVPKQRDPGADESQDRHGHQLVVQGPDPQQSGHGGTEQDPWRLLLLGVQIHPRGLEDVAGLIGTLFGFAQRKEREAQRDTRGPIKRP